MATTKRKSINPYSGSGHQVTYDESKLQPKSAAPNKYTTFATPKGRPNQVKVSPEYGTSGARRTATSRSAVEIRKANAARANRTSKKRK